MMLRRWRLVALVAWNLVLGHALDPSCLKDGKKAVVWEMVQHFNDFTTSAVSKCKTVTHDVYQRFSGYAARHRRALFCEAALGVLQSLQDTSLSNLCGQALSTEESIARMQDLLLELNFMLQDLNAYGDGYILEVVEQHLGAMAGTLKNAARGSTLATVAVTAADTLIQLLHHIFGQLADAVTYNVARLGVGGARNETRSLTRFLASLDGFPATVSLDLLRVSPQCADVQEIYRAHFSYDPVADPASWRSHDVSGLEVPVPAPQKLLFTISQVLPLSYSLIAVAPRSQSGSQELTHEYQSMFEGTGGHSAPSSWMTKTVAEPSCSGKGLAYSPAHCLFDAGWGSMMFSLSTEPPFDGVLAVSEMSQRGSVRRPQPFVQPVANGSESLDLLVDAADRVYKSLNTPSPDVFFLSPMVGNCLTLRRLGPSRGSKALGEAAPQLTPKLIWVPVNPLIAPPWEVKPNFTSWHSQWLQAVQSKASGGSVEVETDGEAIWWLAQCSLSSASAIMEEQGYTLLHLEHTFAVFVLKVVWSAVAPLLRRAAGSSGSSGSELKPGEVSLYDHWARGWHCSPVAPNLFGLEQAPKAEKLLMLQNRSQEAAGRAALCEFLQANHVPLADSDRNLCTSHEAAPALSWRSWELQDQLEEPGKAYMLESTGKGRCLPELGFCECFPPYRGRYCENEQPGKKDAQRPYKAVLHYLVGDREKLLSDFQRTLPILWQRFNECEDYPVVVFHDGLSKASRQRILEASPNRIWFAYVVGYKSVPAYLADRMELQLGGYGVGYRGMCRFRSGPIFMQPVMQGFDYAWTLDTDGYFPADLARDPVERMWREDKVYGYSHVSRDQASAVQHFWEFCRLYIESKGIDPKGTKMMRRLTDALVLRDTYWHEWNRVLFMNDIEITKLSWFQSPKYQDFFTFLDSVGGFWLYRWGDHAVRTIAIALFLDPTKLMRMRVPYGHQNTCRCGDENVEQVCVRSSSFDWWRCIHQAEVKDLPAGSIVATGDVETVKEEILFGES